MKCPGTLMVRWFLKKLSALQLKKTKDHDDEKENNRIRIIKKNKRGKHLSIDTLRILRRDSPFGGTLSSINAETSLTNLSFYSAC